MKLNFSRVIIHHGITLFHLIILQFLLPPVNAQQSTESQLQYNSCDPTAALVIVVLICAFFFAGVLSLFIRQCSEISTIANVPTVATRLSTGIDSAVIEKFPVFFYSEVKDIKIGRETLECAICLSEFEDDETLRLLPKCNHVFHPQCIDEWLACHVTCPVCRAKLTAESGEIEKNPPQEIAIESNQANNSAPYHNLNLPLDEVAITVNEEQNRDPSNTNRTKNRPPRLSISGRFPRSHSTGHSLVQAAESNNERYTLRLSEEVRAQIMAKAKLKRTISFNAVSTKEWSVRKGFRSGGEGSSRGKWSDRWSILTNAPFVNRGSAVKCSKIDNEASSDSVNGRNLLSSVKLNRLSLKVEGVEESSTRIRALV